MMYTRSKKRLRMNEGGEATTPPIVDSELSEDTKNLVETVKKRKDGTMPTGSTIDPKTIEDTVGKKEMEKTFVSYDKLDDADKAKLTKAKAPKDISDPTKPKKGAYDYTATTTVGKTPEAEAATLEREDISPEVTIEAAQGELSEEAKAVAAQAEVQQEQLLSFQLGELYSSMEEGKPLPPWASGPVRAATNVMAQRGLGGSSMAAAAISQAVLESGIPIAAADAAEYSKLNIQNLNNRQQAVLQNAAQQAQMDMANLNARQQAAVENARNFLAIDLANLKNEQATEVLNYQGELQALFTDAAAENAARQFNAKTQQQVDEFFAELGVQVDNANANRTAAMAQFNTDQANSMAQYNASLEDARERFNANMQAQIDQSNATWRRQVATADTAAENEAQRQNAMNVLEVSQSALSALWQRYRDESAWLFQTTENSKQRAHAIALIQYETEASKDLFNMESEYQTAMAVGDAAMAGILGVVTN